MSKVLLVDKDKNVAATLQRFFRDLPIEVVVADSVLEGVSGAGVTADLILVDEVSPGMGSEQAFVIRDRNYATLTPVIAMTSVRLNDEQLRALGYAALLPKPLVAEQVRQTLQRWIPAAAVRPVAAAQGGKAA